MLKKYKKLHIGQTLIINDRVDLANLPIVYDQTVEKFTKQIDRSMFGVVINTSHKSTYYRRVS